MGVFFFFLKSFVLYMLAIYPGQLAVKFIYHYLTPQALSGLRFAWYLLPVLGMGFMFVNFRNGKFPCNTLEEHGGKKQ
jgi:mannose/fructose/N-acetylgalactosamine-specific phosphotransferase system component IIC